MQYISYMKNKSILSFILIGVLSFSYAYSNYMQIIPCLLCILARWTFWLSLIFAWLSIYSHKYIYVSFIGLGFNFLLGLFNLYILIMKIEPSFCVINNLGSCIAWNTFMRLPIPMWISMFSGISMFFAYKALKEGKNSS